MKKRTNVYLEEEDKQIIQFLRVKDGLESAASVVRFLARKGAKEEDYVSSEKVLPWQNSAT
jgi:hypothetical protein